MQRVEPARGIDGFAGAQVRQIELVDNAGVVIGDDVDDEVGAFLIGVDVMEGEGRVGRLGSDERAAVLVEHVKAQAALGQPAIVADERRRRHHQPQRIDDEGKFR